VHRAKWKRGDRTKVEHLRARPKSVFGSFFGVFLLSAFQFP
jgi:hypothetical protein